MKAWGQACENWYENRSETYPEILHEIEFTREKSLRLEADTEGKL
jgi:hypothetical protein